MSASTPTPDSAGSLPHGMVVGRGDPARWFSEEVHIHDGQLKAYLRGKYPDVRSDVDDVVQESYLRVLRRQAAKPIASVKAFLFTSARHLALDLLRKNRRSPIDALGTLADSGVIDDRPIPPDVLSEQEEFDLLAQAVAQLPPRCCEVILLHKIDGLSQREVAGKMGISERTVAHQVRLAMRKLETRLAAQGIVDLTDLNG